MTGFEELLVWSETKPMTVGTVYPHFEEWSMRASSSVWKTTFTYNLNGYEGVYK